MCTDDCYLKQDVCVKSASLKDFVWRSRVRPWTETLFEPLADTNKHWVANDANMCIMDLMYSAWQRCRSLCVGLIASRARLCRLRGVSLAPKIHQTQTLVVLTAEFTAHPSLPEGTLFTIHHSHKLLLNTVPSVHPTSLLPLLSSTLLRACRQKTENNRASVPKRPSSGCFE